MKRLFHTICTCLSLGLLIACEEDLPLYNDNQGMLNFVGDTTYNYSFVYHSGYQQDTIWMEVETMGFMTDEARPFEIKQELTGENDAIAGVHYLSFDNAFYQPYMKIEAGTVKAKVPVIVLRDASLNEEDYVLRVEIADNGVFQPGYEFNSFKVITITNRLVQPRYWNSLMRNFFGAYGTEKHRFMIEHSAFKWDDDFLVEIGVSNSSVDQQYLIYLRDKFRQMLEEENTRRANQGLPPISEKDGTTVTF